MTEFYPTLKKTPLFRGVREDELGQMLKCMGAQTRHFPKGGTVLRAGERAAHIGVVLSGQVQVSREDAEGNRLLLAAIPPGGLFAEAYACAGTEHLPVTVTSVAECDILLLERSRILAPCSSACTFHSLLIGNLMEILASKNMMLSQKLEHMSKRTLREKLLSYLSAQSAEARSSFFTIPFDRQALADYLCVDRSALSREIGKLQREGILTAQRSQFTLL